MTKICNTLTDIDPFTNIENLHDDIRYFKSRVDMLSWISDKMYHHEFSMRGNNGILFEMNALFMGIIQNDLERAVELVNSSLGDVQS